ncbi:uncharacterized protein METZ01_LOCUS171742, partial [marine metagenome]
VLMLAVKAMVLASILLNHCNIRAVYNTS